MKQAIVETVNIKKSYDGVPILKGVDIKLYPGTIHGLFGLNGVGKSTLINILSGIRSADSGDILVDGKPVILKNPLDAKRHGFGTVFQVNDVSPGISVAQYIHLCATALDKSMFKAYRIKDINERCSQALRQYEIAAKPTDSMATLSAGQRQLVSIIAALSAKPRLLMMDEPYNSLSYVEAERLSTIIRRLRDGGMSFLIVSRDSRDIADICDQVTVLDSGTVSARYLSGTKEFEDWTGQFSRKNPVFAYPYIPKNPHRVMMSVENISTNGILSDVSFYLKKGEVLGVSGLVGHDKTSLAHVLFGAEQITSGQIVLNGKKLRLRSPRDAINNKIALVPSNLFREGVIPEFSVSNNISLSNLHEVTRAFIDTRREEYVANKYIKEYVIKTPSASEPTGNLSIGNQHKINIAKWLMSNASILIMDDPTQYLDSSSKVEIYNFMNKFTSEGGSIVFISTDLDELLGMSDRVIVMKRGKISHTLTRDNFSAEGLREMMN